MHLNTNTKYSTLHFKYVLDFKITNTSQVRPLLHNLLRSMKKQITVQQLLQ